MLTDIEFKSFKHCTFYAAVVVLVKYECFEISKLNSAKEQECKYQAYMVVTGEDILFKWL